MKPTQTIARNDLWNRIGNAVTEFFLKPASPKPLAVFRIGLACVLLCQAFIMRESILSFFSASGLVQQDVVDMISDPMTPKLKGLLDFAGYLGISESNALLSFGFVYVLGLLCLAFGIFTNLAALLTWLMHWTLMNTGYSGAYGADMYAHIFLFYLIWMPSGGAYSLDRVLNRVVGEPSFQARLGLRVIQLHLCISYLASGLEKASGVQWWNGEVIWRALNLPGYSTLNMQWLAHFPWIAMVVGWSTLAIEGFYCVMVWPKRTRLLWVLATCGLHLGIAIVLRLHIFGILMCIPTIACFAISAEPRSAE